MLSTEDFEEGFKEYLEGALSEEKQHRYRNAVNLYYKAFLQICNYLIFIQTGSLVNDHKDRNKKLEEINSDILNIRNKLHIIYRGTYKTKKTGLDCKKIKDDIKKLISLKAVKGEIKESAQRL